MTAPYALVARLRQLHRKRPTLTVMTWLMLATTLLGGFLAIVRAQPVSAQSTSTLHLRVQSAREWIPAGIKQGDPIPKYHWLVVQDDTGDPTHYGTNQSATSTLNSNYACTPQSLGGDPNYPANCQWPSIHSAKGGTTAEVVAQGDQSTLSETVGIDTSQWTANDHNPNRSYMISVTAEGYDVPNCTKSSTVTCHVDGFKIDGAWFTLPLNNPGSDPGLVTVNMQPYPLPLMTVRMKVWNDLQTNGAYDTGEPVLTGWEGHITDISGEVTNDWYGNPLCTTYQHDSSGLMLFGANGKPLIQQIGGRCLSDSNGVITIPYLGPDRFSSTVVPPAGQTWYQTTTLEGSHDWDTWGIEGWNGYDPEFVQGAEAFPFAEFGFVQLQASSSLSNAPVTGSTSDTGAIKGVVVGTGTFTPSTGGLTLGGANGSYIIEKIKHPLISLIDTNRNDNTVYVGRGNADGTFQINNVPNSDYVLSYWDEEQSYLLTQVNVSIVNGQMVDLGNLDASAWWSVVKGKVCYDDNRNGKCDSGEKGIPNLTLNLLGRDNSLQFFGSNSATTDSNGNYIFRQAYPLGQWVVEQGYWEQYYTVGVTYQTNNQTSPTTVMANGGFVDQSVFNWIGMSTEMDWAVHNYETDPSLGPTNGGIVGEMVYDPTRFTYDPRMEPSAPNAPGIPDISVHLYAPVKCNPTDPTTIPAGTSCTSETTSFGTTNYLTNNADGSLVKLSDSSGNPIDLADPYTSETWHRPVNCTALGADGAPVQQQVLPPSTGGHECLEAPLMESQVGDNSQTSQPDGVTGAMYVNGNYGFTAISVDPTTGQSLGTDSQGNPITEPLPPGDYIVEPQLPNDPLTGKPDYQVTMEEDLNTASGDQYVAPGETPLNPPLPAGALTTNPGPAIPPAPCVGPLHTVDVVSDPSQANFDPTHPSTTQGVYNPDFLAAGGSPFQGQQRPLCADKLVTVRNGRSATPNFYFRTQNNVPLPGRLFGIVVDDLNLTTDPKNLFYGEKYGIPNLPIGIYDFSNRLVKTIYTDANGAYEVILPSTDTNNCPYPASICPGTYRFVANDPGQPGHPNPGYNPAYRTIGTFWEVWPGVSLPSDLAPTPVAFGIENPGTQTSAPAACLLNDPSLTTAPKVPDFFSVNKPYVLATDKGTARNITINGQDFGAQATGSQVTLTQTNVAGAVPTSAPIVSWSDTQIVIQAPATLSTAAAGPYQLQITNANGKSSVNGLTLQILGPQYNPKIYEVGPGKTYSTTDPNPNNAAHAIQRALDAAATLSGNNPQALVVVYPNTPSSFNPLGSYYENIVVHSPVKLQGVGPGGVRPNGAHVPGTVLDGLGYGTDGARETAWAATISSIGTIIGPNGAPLDPTQAAVPEGEVVLFVANSATQYSLPNGKQPPYTAAIDGMMIQNGDVMDYVPNINQVGNGQQVGGGNNTPTNPNQGGGIVAFASTRYLSITNNLIRSNAGAYAGAIRLGTPLVGDNNLDGVKISHNRILNNGGVNLAGAIGIFTGARGYEVSYNDICGNSSSEYGGGISQYGLSGDGGPNGATKSSVHDNRIYFNGSYDEGGGVIIAGEPPTTVTGVSKGAGAVDIYNNLIQGNLANDDGGGLRFLMAGNFPFNVYNNMIVNNISTHEGGGVAIDNAPDVRFYNNTVMKNITTATAATSNGQPAPAGLSTAENNVYFQATLPSASPHFSNPLMFNNIFWDNRAGRWDGANIIGIGGKVWQNGQLVDDPTPINHWDMGVPGTSYQLSPTNSILQPTSNPGVIADPSNLSSDPLIVSPFDVTLSALAWRGNPNFVASVIVSQDVPVSVMGDYHLTAGSPSTNTGAASKTGFSSSLGGNVTVAAPSFDIDYDLRPSNGGYEIGADEIPGLSAQLSTPGRVAGP